MGRTAARCTGAAPSWRDGARKGPGVECQTRGDRGRVREDGPGLTIGKKIAFAGEVRARHLGAADRAESIATVANDAALIERGAAAG